MFRVAQENGWWLKLFTELLQEMCFVKTKICNYFYYSFSTAKFLEHYFFLKNVLFARNAANKT